MAIEINDKVIKDAVSSAICSIYDLEQINDALIDNDSSLYAHKEELKKIICTIHYMKTDLINALHQYDE